jgi:hypothetical protein
MPIRGARTGRNIIAKNALIGKEAIGEREIRRRPRRKVKDTVPGQAVKSMPILLENSGGLKILSGSRTDC